MAWIWFYTVLVAVWTYWCTRGPDGHFVAATVGFGVLGVLYWLAIYRYRPVTWNSLIHLLILELATVLTLLVNPELDEMAGMLNLWIPFLVLQIVLGGLILSWFLRYLGRK